MISTHLINMPVLNNRFAVWRFVPAPTSITERYRPAMNLAIAVSIYLYPLITQFIGDEYPYFLGSGRSGRS